VVKDILSIFRQALPLVVIVGGLVEEQAPRQLLAVELREQILVADVRQQAGAYTRPLFSST
jgi:hypothetical protein